MNDNLDKYVAKDTEFNDYWCLCGKVVWIDTKTRVNPDSIILCEECYESWEFNQKSLEISGAK